LARLACLRRTSALSPHDAGTRALPRRPVGRAAVCDAGDGSWTSMACYSIATAARLWQAGRSLLLRGCGHGSPYSYSSCLACVLALSTAHRWWQHNNYHPKLCWTSVTALMFVNAGWCSAGDATSQLSPVPPLPTCWPQLWTGKMLPAAVRASSVDGFLAQDLAHCRSRHRCVCRVLQQPAPPHQSR